MSSGHVRLSLGDYAQKSASSPRLKIFEPGANQPALTQAKPRSPTCGGPICVRRGVSAGGSRIRIFSHWDQQPFRGGGAAR
jgi:hypothetical protein